MTAAAEPAPASKGLKQLGVFAALAATGVAISTCTPLRTVLTVENIRSFAERIGWWGPLLLVAAGTVGPLLFLPRWPICLVGGMLYGIFAGTLVANIACAAGAWVHYLSAKWLVSPSSRKALQWMNIDPDRLTPGRAFWLIFILRAFPLSNSAATNVLAGALRMTTASYMLATFIGMIPSTLMYASWGKLMKKPDPRFYAVAVGTLVVMTAGTLLVRRKLFPGNTRETDGRPAPPGRADTT